MSAVGATRSGDASAAAAHPRLAGRRVTDLSAAAGTAAWLALVAGARAGAVALTTVELFVGLAVLALVPLGLGLVAPARPADGPPRAYRLAVAGQAPAAAAAVGALALPVGSTGSALLALPWLAVTGAIAWVGLGRLRFRGPGPLPELAIDAGLLYVPVAAVALVLHRLGIDLRFRSIIVLLTVVHYHYAGFVLPLVTGLAGRRLAGDDGASEDGVSGDVGSGDGAFDDDVIGRVAAAATLVIVVNIGLIAVGITFSPLVEVVAVSLLAVAVAAFALLVLARLVPAVPRLPGALLAVGALSIVVTMALALAYGYSAFSPAADLITIGGMVRWHGTLNALGFAAPALLAFRLLQA